MHANFVTLWLQVVQPLTNVHETKWMPHVKRPCDAARYPRLRFYPHQQIPKHKCTTIQEFYTIVYG